MEVTIYINGQAVSVQVSVEVYDYLNKANHKDENLLHEQRRHWDGHGLDAIAFAHPSRVETPEQHLCRKETMSEIAAVLDACTATQRERFLLYALEGIPYTAQMIATITRHQIGTVERALQIFLKLGLVEELPSGAYYMSNIEMLIGQSSTEGERKRRARQAVWEQKRLGGQMSAHLVDVCPPEIERELDIDIEKEKEKERELERGQISHAYGRYHNVILTDAEITELKTDLPTYQAYIEKLSAYMASSGKRYQNHAATIRRWAEADEKKSGLPDYSFKEGESL